MLFTLLFGTLSCTNKKVSKNGLTNRLKIGDLLFQNTGTGNIEKAINEVTKTKKSSHFNHVGIAIVRKGQWHVLEAINKEGVTVTALDVFLQRNTHFKNVSSSVAIYRLDSNYIGIIPDAIKYGLGLVGKPYDNIFLWDDQDAYYCSELIYKMLEFSIKKTNHNIEHPFKTHAMTFKNKSCQTLPEWKSYYQRLGADIPEGETGTNPNLMASSKYIQRIDFQ